MGRLKERRIVQSRIYLDGKQEPIPVYDYDYTYPKTVYDAIRKTFDDDSTTLTEEINAIYRLIAEKQPILSGGGAGKLMTWSGIDGVVGETEIIKTINREPNARSHSKVPSERAVGEIMDTKVSAATFEAHVRDKDIHITEEERDKWNSMAPAQDFNHHITDQFVHITMDERESWNKKADQSDLNEHILDINNPHNVTAHQVGTYSRKEIDEMINKQAKGWTTQRMGKVDLTILRLAVYEIIYDENVPVGVAINEAVELAKRYGQDESSGFVNGILAKFAK